MTNAALRGKPDAGNLHVVPSQRYGGTSRSDGGTHVVLAIALLAAVASSAAQLNGPSEATNAYSVAAGETLSIADKNGADATLPASIQAKVSFWVDASKNLVRDGSGNLIAWLDARETPVADADAYEARTDWTYPRAITYKGGSYPADYPLVKSDVVSFDGKPYVDFGEYRENKWMLFVDAEGNRKKVNLVGFSGYVGFGNSAGFVLCDVANPDIAADPNDANVKNNGRPFYHKGTGGGDGKSDMIYSPNSGIGSESSQNPKCWAETRINGEIVNPMSSLHRRNGWETFTQNGPTISINDEVPYVTTFFNCGNFKGSYTDRQGGGKIAEMIMFSSVLTQDELAEVEAYLRQKWNGGSTLGTVTLADGATLEVANDKQTVVRDVSGGGDIVKSGSGELKIDRNCLLERGSLTLNGGSVRTYQKRNHLPPVKAVGGTSVSATDRQLTAGNAVAADTFSVTADAVGRKVEIGAVDAGVAKVAVSKAVLTIRPKAMSPSVAPSVNLISNGSFEADDITTSSGYKNYSGAMTGWSSSSMKSSAFDCGVATHGSAWVNNSTDTAVPDGNQCAYIQIKNANSTNGISQTVTTTNGLYRFSSWIRCRNRGYTDNTVLFVLVVDGKPVLVRRTSKRCVIQRDNSNNGFSCVETKNELNFQKIVTEIAMDAGEHTIHLLAAMPPDMVSSASDRALDIDDVRLELVKTGTFVQISDPGFESCALVMPLNSYNGCYSQSQDVTTFWELSHSGIARHEGIWFWIPDPAVEDEDQEAYLQTSGAVSESTLSKTVTLPKSGRARLSLRYANRSHVPNSSAMRASGQTVAVSLGGAEVFSAAVTNEIMTRALAEIDVTAGEQSLVISSRKDPSETRDLCTIVDDIRIEYVDDETGIVRDPGFSDGSTAWTITSASRGGTTGLSIREAVFLGTDANSASAAQTVNIPSDGAYLLRFRSRGCPLSATGLTTGVYHGYTRYTHDLEVYMDGTLVANVYNAEDARHVVEVRLPYLAAGTHTLEFRGAAQQETGLCQSRISDPEIVPLETGEMADWSNTKIELSDGATLNLDFEGALRCGSVRLGNVKVTSGTVDAQTHPGQVVGAGKLEVLGCGMMIIVL